MTRLSGLNAFTLDAVRLVTRKVAAVSGDARRSLDICRRATELPAPDETVKISHIEQAISEMTNSNSVKIIRWFFLPLHEAHRRSCALLINFPLFFPEVVPSWKNCSCGPCRKCPFGPESKRSICGTWSNISSRSAPSKAFPDFRCLTFFTSRIGSSASACCSPATARTAYCRGWRSTSVKTTSTTELNAILDPRANSPVGDLLYFLPKSNLLPTVKFLFIRLCN